METVTKAGLWRLVSLYRQDIDGAAAQLDDLIERHGDQLHALLGDVAFDGGSDRVEQLARATERSRRRHSSDRDQHEREEAARLAHDLMSRSGWIGPDRLGLDPGKLAALVACGSYDWLVLDRDGLRGVDRRRIHALLRACRRAEAIEVEAARHEVVVRYQTEHGRGRVRLWIQPAPTKARPLVVEWAERHEPVAPARAAEAVPEFSSSLEPTARVVAAAPDVAPPVRHVERPLPTTESPPPKTRRPPARTMPSFLRHVLDAVSEVGR